MSDDLISRKEALERLRLLKRLNTTEAIQIVISVAEQQINNCKTAFDKEKVIEELKSWEKASYNAGIQNNYVGLDNKASGYYQESRAYHRAIEIVEKGGLN